MFEENLKVELACLKRISCYFFKYPLDIYFLSLPPLFPIWRIEHCGWLSGIVTCLVATISSVKSLYHLPGEFLTTQPPIGINFKKG